MLNTSLKVLYLQVTTLNDLEIMAIGLEYICQTKWIPEYFQFILMLDIGS